MCRNQPQMPEHQNQEVWDRDYHKLMAVPATWRGVSAEPLLLGVSIRTSHGYANGVPIPEGYAKLLRLMVRLNLKPEDVK